jgi:hypothetical protein
MFDLPAVRPEFRQQWASSFKTAANFFKHGRHDDEKILEFDASINEFMLMASAHGLSRMGEEPGMEELAIAYWTFFSHPNYFDNREALHANPKVKALKNLVPHGPKVFLKGFERAWNAGYIRR